MKSDRVWERTLTAIELIATDRTLKSIADELGVNPSTIYQDLFRHEWTTAAMRLDFLDDPDMMESCNEDLRRNRQAVPERAGAA